MDVNPKHQVLAFTLRCKGQERVFSIPLPVTQDQLKKGIASCLDREAGNLLSIVGPEGGLLSLQAIVNQPQNFQKKEVTAIFAEDGTEEPARKRLKTDPASQGTPATRSDKLLQFFKKVKRADVQTTFEEDGIEEVEPDLPFVGTTGDVDLFNLIDLDQTNCLNEKKERMWTNVFQDDATCLVSDCDEQLLLAIRFRSKVEIRSLIFKSPTPGVAPKKIKLFKNSKDMDFDSVDDDATQELEIPASHYTGSATIPVTFLLWRDVTWLTIFVQSNHGGGAISALSKLKILGVKV